MSTDSIPAELTLLRQQIDRLDHALVLLLANRFALTERVGRLKMEQRLEAFDPQREEGKLREIRSLCMQHNVNPELVADVLAQIMRELVKNHNLMREHAG
jgi:chorismate mutase